MSASEPLNYISAFLLILKDQIIWILNMTDVDVGGETERENTYKSGDTFSSGLFLMS